MDELLAVIQGAQLIENKKDEWIWRLEGEGLYTVNFSYVFFAGTTTGGDGQCIQINLDNTTALE